MSPWLSERSEARLVFLYIFFFLRHRWEVCKFPRHAGFTRTFVSRNSGARYTVDPHRAHDQRAKSCSPHGRKEIALHFALLSLNISWACGSVYTHMCTKSQEYLCTGTHAFAGGFFLFYFADKPRGECSSRSANLSVKSSRVNTFERISPRLFFSLGELSGSDGACSVHPSVLFTSSNSNHKLKHICHHMLTACLSRVDQDRLRTSQTCMQRIFMCKKCK